MKNCMGNFYRIRDISSGHRVPARGPGTSLLPKYTVKKCSIVDRITLKEWMPISWCNNDWSSSQYFLQYKEIHILKHGSTKWVQQFWSWKTMFLSHKMFLGPEVVWFYVQIYLWGVVFVFKDSQWNQIYQPCVADISALSVTLFRINVHLINNNFSLQSISFLSRLKNPELCFGTKSFINTLVFVYQQSFLDSTIVWIQFYKQW